MPDHAQLLAAIETGEQTTREAAATFPAGWTFGADALRRYAHYRDILRRHHPTTVATFPGATYCAGCSTIDHNERVVALVLLSRCRELPGLADALGLGEHHDH